MSKFNVIRCELDDICERNNGDRVYVYEVIYDKPMQAYKHKNCISFLYILNKRKESIVKGDEIKLMYAHKLLEYKTYQGGDLLHELNEIIHNNR